MMEDIVIIGYGGHAKSLADSIEREGIYNVVGYTDISDSKCQYEYLGTDSKLNSIYNRGVHNAVLGVGYMGNSTLRIELFKFAKEIGYSFPVIIDPSAIVANDAVIGEGTFIGKNAVVNATSVIGKNCIINTCALIEHDSKIGDYSHIAIGCNLCGAVEVGQCVLVGAGTTVIQGVHIGDNSIVGANSTILSDVVGSAVYCGIVK